MIKSHWRTHRLTKHWLISLLLVVAGCNSGEQQISGQVVADSGAAIGAVAVTACYSGWGWSAGQLVWDKEFCSAPVLTDAAGGYRISFSGPDSTRLRAEKTGWVQTRDFHLSDRQLVLTPLSVHQARSAREMQERVATFRSRLAGESAAEYYCRVLLTRGREVSLAYPQEQLSITPVFLPTEGESTGYFAVRGSVQTAHLLCREAQLRVNGEPVSARLQPSPAAASCDAGVQLIEVRFAKSRPRSMDRIELLLPSLKAMFELQPWDQA